jgi:hypothetical protein
MTTVWFILSLLASFFLLFSVHALPSSDILRVLGPQGVNLWKLQKSRSPSISRGSSDIVVQEDTTYLESEPDTISGFRAQWFRQPLDHFSRTSNHTFLQRFWVNSRYYRPGFGGPVIVLDGGETSGEVSSSVERPAILPQLLLCARTEFRFWILALLRFWPGLLVALGSCWSTGTMVRS